MKAVIVIPSIREPSFLQWFSLWREEFRNHVIIIVEDNPKKTFAVPRENNIIHYAWDDINKELGKNSWIIPRRTDCVRSFGFYKAFQLNPDMVVTIDDDCLPDDKDFLKRHWEALTTPRSIDWFQHAPGLRVRGLPYKLETAEVILNMGLWSHIPDIDGTTQLQNMNYRAQKSEFNYPAPEGYFIPLSGMNLAFRPKIIPAFYFLLMGRNYEYDRFGDIWAGIFLKKICDHLDVKISGGTPYIRHERASDPHVNIKKETEGIKINEYLWKDVKKIKIRGSTFGECYISLAKQLPVYSPYWEKQKEAMKTWVTLFKKL